jgi:hypothetical protein
VNAQFANFSLRLGIFVVPLLLIQIYQKRAGIEPWVQWKSRTQWISVGAAALLVLFLGAPNMTEFIYFQF